MADTIIVVDLIFKKSFDVLTHEARLRIKQEVRVDMGVLRHIDSLFIYLFL